MYLLPAFLMVKHIINKFRQEGGKKETPPLPPAALFKRSFCLSGSKIGTGDQFESILKEEEEKKREGEVVVNEGGGGGMWLARPLHHHIYPPSG